MPIRPTNRHDMCSKKKSDSRLRVYAGFEFRGEKECPLAEEKLAFVFVRAGVFLDHRTVHAQKISLHSLWWSQI